jgi:hypothetical protein
VSDLRLALHLAFGALAVLLLLLPGAPVSAHGGGIDAYGGHNDNKRGNYHAHQGTCSGQTFASKSEAIRAGCKKER